MKSALAASLLVVLAAAPALAGDDTVVKGDLGAKLDHAVQIHTKGGFWGTVLVARGGELVLSKGYGNADYMARPNGPRTIFEIASVSKMFTATAILLLEKQGKLSTDDAIGKFFAGVPADKKAITVQQLLTHTSGISPEVGLGYASKETREEFVAYVMGEDLVAKPGERFEYCNVGYALLAAIVEKASGESFESYVRKNIFAAAGMKDTGFLNDKELDKARAAARLNDGELDRSAVEWDWSWGYRGMGGVATTALDLLRFDRALRANEVLDAATQKKQTTVAKEHAAAGCFVEKTFRGTTKVHHSGSVGGFSSLFARYVEDDLVVVVLTNDNSDPVEVEKALVETIFPPPTADLEILVGKSPPENGAFIIKDGSTWKVSRAEGEVVLAIRSGDATPARMTLKPESARGLASLLQQALDARAQEGTKDEGTAMETDLYTSSYTPTDGKVEVEKLEMRVMPRYTGANAEGERVEDSRLTLVLVDESAGFWPLIVKMTSATAKVLVKDIEAALK